jgi:hypothetical protein
MFYVMNNGIDGWRLQTENHTADALLKSIKILDDQEKGKNKFPPGSDNKIKDYKFSLHRWTEPVMTFSWLDYGGGILLTRETEVHSELNRYISTSTVLYIFLDGEYFALSETKEKQKIKIVNDKCSRYIMPVLTEYSLSQNKMPPIVFVITKDDLIGNYTNKDDLRKILKEAFSGLFGNLDVPVYTTAVTLGNNIADNDYTGEANPENVEIPLMIGIYHEIKKQYNCLSPSEKNATGEQYREMINELVEALQNRKEKFSIIKNGQFKEFKLGEWLVK